VLAGERPGFGRARRHSRNHSQVNWLQAGRSFFNSLGQSVQVSPPKAQGATNAHSPKLSGALKTPERGPGETQKALRLRGSREPCLFCCLMCLPHTHSSCTGFRPHGPDPAL